jgi:hypothetical protein
MKLKIQEIQSILGSTIYDKVFPTKTSYQISRLAKVLIAEMATFDTERQKLIEKFNGVLNDDKTQFVFSPEDGPGFTAAMTELLTTEIEVPFEPLPLAAFGDVKLTPNDLSQIEPLIIPEV